MHETSEKFHKEIETNNRNPRVKKKFIIELKNNLTTQRENQQPEG